jgi:cobalt-zinc-cadmium efflux system outer membrane protein
MSPIAKRRAVQKKPSFDRFIAALLASGVAASGQAVSAQAASAPTVSAQPFDEITSAKQICQAGPSARVARAQRLAGASHKVAADVLPNPSLVLEHQRALSGPSDHETVIGLSVPVGVSGRRSLLQQAATAHDERGWAEADSTLFRSALAFRRAYARATIDDARVAVLARQQAKLDAVSATTAALALGGEAAEYDSLRQRVHAREHQRVLESARAQAGASRVLLEAWLGAKVVLAPEQLHALAGGETSDAARLDAVATQHAELRGLDAEARASGLEARAARRLWVPEAEVFAGYRTTGAESDTGHGISLALRVPLTFFDHGQAEAARASARHEQALAEADRLRRDSHARLQSVDTRVRMLTTSAESQQAAAQDASSLQEKAEQLYVAGEASITELLEAFRAAEQAELGLIDLAAEIAQARLERMEAAGSLLDPSLDKACSATRRRTP